MSPTPQSLTFRKLAGDDGIQRVAGYHPLTGEKTFLNAGTLEPMPKPLLGVEIVSDTHEDVIIPMKTVVAAIAEGWMVGEGEEVVHRPGGTVEDPWRVTHTFRKFSGITIKCLSGDAVYSVVHNPDKYDDETGQPTENAGDPTTHVDWFYILKLEV